MLNPTKVTACNYMWSPSDKKWRLWNGFVDVGIKNASTRFYFGISYSNHYRKVFIHVTKGVSINKNMYNEKVKDALAAYIEYLQSIRDLVSQEIGTDQLLLNRQLDILDQVIEIEQYYETKT